MSEIVDILLGLGDKFAAHIVLSASAIGLGIAVALPVGVWASRSPAVSRIALGFASLVQTIPALALLALFFPILLELARGLWRRSADAWLPTRLVGLGALFLVAHSQECGDRACQS